MTTEQRIGLIGGAECLEAAYYKLRVGGMPLTAKEVRKIVKRIKKVLEEG